MFAFYFIVAHKWRVWNRWLCGKHARCVSNKIQWRIHGRSKAALLLTKPLCVSRSTALRWQPPSVCKLYGNSLPSGLSGITTSAFQLTLRTILCTKCPQQPREIWNLVSRLTFIFSSLCSVLCSCLCAVMLAKLGYNYQPVIFLTTFNSCILLVFLACHLFSTS